jgi:hypothetical membrane protein
MQLPWTAKSTKVEILTNNSLSDLGVVDAIYARIGSGNENAEPNRRSSWWHFLQFFSFLNITYQRIPLV